MRINVSFVIIIFIVSLAAPTDSYGAYSNVNYSNSQAGYDEYSSGYMDGSGYGAPVQGKVLFNVFFLDFTSARINFSLKF